MTRKSCTRLALSLVLVVLLAAVPARPAAAQPPSGTVAIQVDSPASGTVVTNGRLVVIGGWAIDPSGPGPGTGVDMVSIFLDGGQNGGGTLLGIATYGKARTDVALAKGNSRFSASGFDLLWTPTGLAPGPHTLNVYAHSIVNGWYAHFVPLMVSAQGPAAASSTGSVEIADFSFRPEAVTLKLGDTLTWTNRGQAGHTATSDTGLWDTGLLQAGQSASYTFRTAGVFSYHCAVHPNMRGAVTVTAAGPGR
jgi:plastocyanin